MTGGTFLSSTTVRLMGGAKLLPNEAVSVPLDFDRGVSQSLPFGTGSGLANIVCALSRPLPAGGSETLNIFDGTVLDVWGDPAAFRVLRSFALWVSSGGDTAGVTIGNAATNGHPLFTGAAAHTTTAYPSSPAVTGGSAAGVAVTSTACNLKVVNNSAVAATYALLLAGSSASSGSPGGLLLALAYP